MAKTPIKTVKMTGELQYARLIEENRDMGNPDKGVDYSDTGGVYKLDLIVTEDEMNKAIAQGLPAKQGAFEMFKAAGDGKFKYTVRRPHLHKHFMQYDENNNPTSERLVVGPPEVFDLKAYGEAYKSGQNPQIKDFLWGKDPLGNGTTATVKMSVRTGVSGKGKSFQVVQMEQVGIIDHVVFERIEAEEWVE